MSFATACHEKAIANVTFAFSNYLMNRKGIMANYRQLMRSENSPYESLQDTQLNKLVRVLQYANDRVPYYQKKFREIGLDPRDIKRLEDMEAIPPLTRQDVIENRADLVDSQIAASMPVADNSSRGPAEPLPLARFRKHKLVRNTSSGSTGAPTIFYEDGSVTALNWVHELRFRKWFGIDPGAREARLARISVDYMPKSTSHRLRKLLWNQLILPGVNLQEGDYDLCARRIQEFRPRVMWGFTSAFTGLAEHIKKNSDRLQPYSPELIITWAAPLYDHERELLAEVFDCPLTNIYGAREVGHVAAQCREGVFHINQENYLVETVPVDEVPSDEGAGELLVTPLIETPMPFIRYRMGDIGKVTPSACGCGKSLQEMRSFLGRTGEVFKTRDGRMISPNFWCRTFMDAKMAGAVERFQVVYLKNGNIAIKLVRKPNYSQDTESHLRRHLERNFQAGTEVRFDYVETIKPQLSGKYQMVMKET
ncbi:MAG: hypothetical protein ABFQ82_03590 [Thermodesulfobacteriota bacterium]